MRVRVCICMRMCGRVCVYEIVCMRACVVGVCEKERVGGLIYNTSRVCLCCSALQCALQCML